MGGHHLWMLTAPEVTRKYFELLDGLHLRVPTAPDVIRKCFKLLNMVGRTSVCHDQDVSIVQRLGFPVKPVHLILVVYSVVYANPL